MIRNKDSKQRFIASLLSALIVHAAILALIKRPLNDFGNREQVSKLASKPLEINQIKLINPSEVDKYRTVGVKGGKKDLKRPDLRSKPKQSSQQMAKKKSPIALSLENLAPQLQKPAMKKTQNDFSRALLSTKSSNEKGGHFYFNKSEKIIPRTTEQEEIKTQASKNFTAPQNKATDKISNFEIRFERPEGVSEDELNSDEKAYYSFYVRSYQNYFSKIYANYEKIVIERPGLASVFDKKHLLIGRIDYDQEGNIVTVKIIKSDESDDLHYFFEETLKQLAQPNPPRVFTKNRKQFSIYYQLQIN